jgi:uncharacterized protein (DUF488 family)
MKENREAIEIYTIGHSNLAADQFVANLQALQIEKVVDVRSHPQSRFSPQFNRKALTQTLDESGIGYEFMGESLGGRPADPTCYKNGELPPPKSDFLNLIDYATVATRPWYLDGIEKLVELARGNRIAIMCSEEDPMRCHRHHLITQTLLERRTTVRHIRKTGTVQEALNVE